MTLKSIKFWNDEKITLKKSNFEKSQILKKVKFWKKSNFEKSQILKM